MNPEIVRLGSLYVNGQSFAVGGPYNSGVLSFGDSIAGKEIQWVKDGDMLIASSCVCTNISWDELDRMGFVSGAAVLINNVPYLCRCLKVGEKEGVPNEWDAVLDKYGESDSLWHWDGIYFWGQEVVLNRELYRATRGWLSAREWYGHDTSIQYAIIGFRPMLEPLIPQPSEALLGSSITVFGPCGESVKGELIGVDDFDLILVPESKMKFSWAARRGDQFVICRCAVFGISKN